MITLALAACAPESRGSDAPPTPPRPPSTALAEGAVIAGEWRLVEMNSRPAPQGRDPDDAHHPITLTVGDFSLRARSQCVAFWRTFEWSGEQLVVRPANPGAMCARGLSNWEAEFDRSLSSVDRATRSGGTLTLTGSDAWLVFVSAPPLEPVGFIGRWRLRSFDGQAPAAGEPAPEIEVTRDEIRADACVFSGWRYRQDGPLLEVRPVQGSVCERMITPQEQRFGAAMDRLHRVTVLPDGALILDTPSEQLEFRRIG